ncbi:hypothetical protein ACI782_05675 [Geodermatophilus sp. SYSU D00703]
MADDRSSALLIRVWLENADAFRARLTSLAGATDQSPAHEVTVAVTSSPGEVLNAVRDWLDDFIGDGTDPIDSGG